MPVTGKFTLALLLLVTLSAAAVIEIEPLPNQELETRYRAMLEEMRCPKCQNQNLKDSNSPIAADLRGEIRRLLEEGRTDDEIVTYLVDRYGDFVRYRPALKNNTLVLWFGPGALILVAVLVGILIVRRQRKTVVETPSLSTTEQQRLNELLDKGSKQREDKH